MDRKQVSKSISQIADLLEMVFGQSKNFDDKTLKLKIEAYAPIYEMAMSTFPLLLTEAERGKFSDLVYSFSHSLKEPDLKKVLKVLAKYDKKYGLGAFKQIGRLEFTRAVQMVYNTAKTKYVSATVKLEKKPTFHATSYHKALESIRSCLDVYQQERFDGVLYDFSLKTTSEDLLESLKKLLVELDQKYGTAKFGDQSLDAA